MRTAHHRASKFALAITGVCAALILPACVKQAPESAPVSAAASTADTSQDQLQWAREALQRNPALEVVAVDSNAGVLTVRTKASGEIRALKVTDLAAVPVAALAAPQPSAGPGESTQPTQPAQTAQAAPTEADRSPAPSPTASLAAAPERSTSTTAPSYTIERSDGQVKVSGPGVSIVSAGATTITPDAGSTSQRSMEPIICEGRRMLHFDNRSIYVEGDAIVARGGCELFVTNSRIVATGTGIVIDDATVHIANSTVEGSTASFDAREPAKVYLRSSTLQGLPRRAEGAVVQDQGGNQWR